MKIDKTYQGWTNEETWQVALILDNTKDYQDKALHACKAFTNDFKRFKLLGLVVTLGKQDKDLETAEIINKLNFAKINFQELIEHYNTKNAELKEYHFQQTLADNLKFQS